MSVVNISAKELQDLIKTQPEKLEIVDTRTPEEYASRHIDGAKSVSLDDLPSKINEIDWSKDVIFYCNSGGRSSMAANFVSSLGKNVWNLQGGMVAFLG